MSQCGLIVVQRTNEMQWGGHNTMCTPDFTFLSNSLSDLISDLLLGASWAPGEFGNLLHRVRSDARSVRQMEYLCDSISTRCFHITAQPEFITCPVNAVCDVSELSQYERLEHTSTSQ